MAKLKFDDIEYIEEKTNTTKPEETHEIGTIVKIPLDKIKIGENIRDVMDDDEEMLLKLGESIKEQGQIEPCIVYQEGDIYILKAGSRRFKASTLVELETLDCIISKKFENEMERIIYQATENEHRSDMSSREREKYMARLSELGLSNVEIARKLHKSTGWVSQALTVHETLKKESFISELKNEEEPTTRTVWEFGRLSEDLKEKVKENITESKKNNKPTNLKNEIQKVKEEVEEKEEQKKQEKELNDKINKDFNIEQSKDDSFGIEFEVDEGNETEIVEEKDDTDEKTIGIHFTFAINENSKSFKFKSDKKDFDTDIEKYVIRMIENYYMDKGYQID